MSRDPQLVMSQYRKHILACKRKWSTARGLIHYRGYVQEYLTSKRLILNAAEAKS